MKESLLKMLACPTCGQGLAVEGPPPSPEGEILEGRLICPAGHAYPIRAGVPRFVSDDAYVDNFSFEWKLHCRTQMDTCESKVSEEDFRRKTGLLPDQVRGKRILDVGCGMGRFLDVVARWGGEVVGIDLSYAVDAAFVNLGRGAGVHVVQADVFSLPFQEGCFDIIYSIGVLHHTPDCRAAFLRLPRLLVGGGHVCVWVYGRYNKLQSFTSDCWRAITTRLPKRFLYSLCYLSVPLYYLYRIPGIGHLLRNLFPISMQKRRTWRVLDTFDWYSPKYQSKHTYPEVFSWFREAGLRQLMLYEPPVAVRGTRDWQSPSQPSEAPGSGH